MERRQYKYLNAECGVRNAERPHYTTFRSQGKLYECRTQNAERLCSAELRKQGKIILVRNAERGVRNDFTTLRCAHKENYMNAERRMHNALKIKNAII